MKKKNYHLWEKSLSGVNDSSEELFLSWKRNVTYSHLSTYNGNELFNKHGEQIEIPFSNRLIYWLVIVIIRDDGSKDKEPYQTFPSLEER